MSQCPIRFFVDANRRRPQHPDFVIAPAAIGRPIIAAEHNHQHLVAIRQ